LGFEDAIFLMQVSDDVLRVTIDPASEHGEQQLENHGLSSGIQA
jgi:hypothetical protein